MRTWIGITVATLVLILVGRNSAADSVIIVPSKLPDLDSARRGSEIRATIRNHSRGARQAFQFFANKAAEAEMSRNLARVEGAIERALSQPGNDFVLVVSEIHTHPTGYTEVDAPTVVGGRTTLEAAKKFASMARLTKARPGFTRSFSILVARRSDEGQPTLKTMVGGETLIRSAHAALQADFAERAATARHAAREAARAEAERMAEERRRQEQERERHRHGDHRPDIDPPERPDPPRPDPPRPDPPRPDPPDRGHPDVDVPGPRLHLGDLGIAPHLVCSASQARTLLAGYAHCQVDRDQSNYIEILDEDGNVVRRIELPFQQGPFWRSAIVHALSGDYWGTFRSKVDLGESGGEALCRQIISEPLKRWFDRFHEATGSTVSEQTRARERAMIDEIIEQVPDAHISVGYCGSESEPSGIAPSVIAIDDQKSEETLWLNASGEAPARMCRRMGNDLRSGVRLTCNFVGTDLRANHDGSVFFQSEEPAKVSQFLFLEIDGQLPSDICIVAERPEAAPLPHAIQSGSVSMPGGKAVPNQTVGQVMCALSQRTGRIAEQPIVFPPTWVGSDGARSWLDVDGDGTTDLCRIVSPIGAYATEALVMCSQLKLEGRRATLGSTYVELLEF